MSVLERLIPTPRLLEVDFVDVAAPPEEVWEIVRYGDIAQSSVARALFAIRELPARLSGERLEKPTLSIDALASTPERPGFQVLGDDPPREVAVGAIGKVWESSIPFVHVRDARAYAAFQEPGYAKVAWALQLERRGERDTRLTFEVRVDATDDESLVAFKRYFRVIGPASRFIRRSSLGALARKLGRPEEREEERSLPGDDLMSDVRGDVTGGITIDATPARIWPFLVQMGCRRAGFYSIDALDNGGERSAREIHPELQHLEVGDMLPATPEGEGAFEVLALDPERALVLGGLWDTEAGRQLRFREPRPPHYWQSTWAFALEPLDAKATRLHVRARASYSEHFSLRGSLIGPVHRLMERAQLEHLKARAEDTLPRDDGRDMASGLAGAAVMAASFATPFLRSVRAHWGVDAETAARTLPGDELVPDARWGWTHGIEIEAAAAEVWSWVAQIGANKGGFYSYQSLENVVGCDVRNAEVVHPEWEVRRGGHVQLHPKMPPLEVVALEAGRWFVLSIPVVAKDRAAGRPWSAASWLFHVEPLGADRCRLISRYRVAFSDDVASRLSFGPTLLEPIGFAMDRRMLLGVKERAEKAAQRPRGTQPPARPTEGARGGAA